MAEAYLEKDEESASEQVNDDGRPDFPEFDLTMKEWPTEESVKQALKH
jgi:hypothetical protein